MEFAKLLTADDHEAGAEMEILHPVTGAKTGAFLLVRGVDSRTFRTASSEFNRKRAAKDSDDDALSLDLTVSIVCGWRGIKQDGEDKPFSKESVRAMMEGSPKIRAQVEAWFLDRKNFTKG